MPNPFETLSDYYFDRDSFLEVWDSNFNGLHFDPRDLCQQGYHDYNYLFYYEQDEYYIIHLPSGTIVHWYKHAGRCNTCNKENFTLEHLGILFNEVRQIILKEFERK